MQLCRHCRPRHATRPRGLCQGCYGILDVRQKYPSGNPYLATAIGLGHRGYQLPEPTAALPGTPAKIEVLAERARRGESLWHPLDTRL